MKYLAVGDGTEKDIYSLAHLDSEFAAYNNIMLVIAAYVARKTKAYDLAGELMRKCSNGLYRAMWNRWK